MALEHLFHIMLVRAKHWVACWQPPTLVDTVGFWDNFLVTQGAGGVREAPKALAGGSPGPRPRGGKPKAPEGLWGGIFAQDCLTCL